MKIPKHVQILSIIFFLNAAVSSLIGGAVLVPVLFAMLGKQADLVHPSDPVVQNLPLLGLNILVSLISILALIWLGVSLRKLKPWVRQLTLAYSILAILFFLFNMFAGDGNLSLGVFVQVYAIWVLLQSDVKEAFGLKIERPA